MRAGEKNINGRIIQITPESKTGNSFAFDANNSKILNKPDKSENQEKICEILGFLITLQTINGEENGGDLVSIHNDIEFSLSDAKEFKERVIKGIEKLSKKINDSSGDGSKDIIDKLNELKELIKNIDDKEKEEIDVDANEGDGSWENIFSSVCKSYKDYRKKLSSIEFLEKIIKSKEIDEFPTESKSEQSESSDSSLLRNFRKFLVDKPKGESFYKILLQEIDSELKSIPVGLKGSDRKSLHDLKRRLEFYYKNNKLNDILYNLENNSLTKGDSDFIDNLFNVCDKSTRNKDQINYAGFDDMEYSTPKWLRMAVKLLHEYNYHCGGRLEPVLSIYANAQRAANETTGDKNQKFQEEFVEMSKRLCKDRSTLDPDKRRGHDWWAKPVAGAIVEGARIVQDTVSGISETIGRVVGAVGDFVHPQGNLGIDGALHHHHQHNIINSTVTQKNDHPNKNFWTRFEEESSIINSPDSNEEEESASGVAGFSLSELFTRVRNITLYGPHRRHHRRDLRGEDTAKTIPVSIKPVPLIDHTSWGNSTDFNQFSEKIGNLFDQAINHNNITNSGKFIEFLTKDWLGRQGLSTQSSSIQLTAYKRNFIIELIRSVGEGKEWLKELNTKVHAAVVGQPLSRAKEECSKVVNNEMLNKFPGLDARLRATFILNYIEGLDPYFSKPSIISYGEAQSNYSNPLNHSIVWGSFEHVMLKLNYLFGNPENLEQNWLQSLTLSEVIDADPDESKKLMFIFAQAFLHRKLIGEVTEEMEEKIKQGGPEAARLINEIVEKYDKTVLFPVIKTAELNNHIYKMQEKLSETPIKEDIIRGWEAELGLQPDDEVEVINIEYNEFSRGAQDFFEAAGKASSRIQGSRFNRRKREVGPNLKSLLIPPTKDKNSDVPAVLNPTDVRNINKITVRARPGSPFALKNSNNPDNPDNPDNLVTLSRQALSDKYTEVLNQKANEVIDLIHKTLPLINEQFMGSHPVSMYTFESSIEGNGVPSRKVVFETLESNNKSKLWTCEFEPKKGWFNKPELMNLTVSNASNIENDVLRYVMHYKSAFFTQTNPSKHQSVSIQKTVGHNDILRKFYDVTGVKEHLDNKRREAEKLLEGNSPMDLLSQFIPCYDAVEKVIKIANGEEEQLSGGDFVDGVTCGLEVGSIAMGVGKSLKPSIAAIKSSVKLIINSSWKAIGSRAAGQIARQAAKELGKGFLRTGGQLAATVIGEVVPVPGADDLVNYGSKKMLSKLSELRKQGSPASKKLMKSLTKKLQDANLIPPGKIRKHLSQLPSGKWKLNSPNQLETIADDRGIFFLRGKGDIVFVKDGPDHILFKKIGNSDQGDTFVKVGAPSEVVHIKLSKPQIHHTHDGKVAIVNILGEKPKIATTTQGMDGLDYLDADDKIIVITQNNKQKALTHTRIDADGIMHYRNADLKSRLPQDEYLRIQLQNGKYDFVPVKGSNNELTTTIKINNQDDVTIRGLWDVTGEGDSTKLVTQKINDPRVYEVKLERGRIKSLELIDSTHADFDSLIPIDQQLILPDNTVIQRPPQIISGKVDDTYGEFINHKGQVYEVVDSQPGRAKKLRKANRRQETFVASCTLGRHRRRRMIDGCLVEDTAREFDIIDDGRRLHLPIPYEEKVRIYDATTGNFADGSDDFLATLSEDQKIKFNDLKVDPLDNKPKPGEAAAAVQLEQITGGRIRRPSTETARHDFVIEGSGVKDGKLKIDMMYTPNDERQATGINGVLTKNFGFTRGPNQEGKGVQKIIENHLQKCDILYMDFRSLSEQNRQKLTDLINKLPHDQRSKIVIIQ